MSTFRMVDGAWVSRIWSTDLMIFAKRPMNILEKVKLGVTIRPEFWLRAKSQHGDRYLLIVSGLCFPNIATGVDC